MNIKVQYTDGTIGVYGTFEEAQKDILETVCGCDFAATIHSIGIFDKDDNEILPLECTWSVKVEVPDPTRIR